MDLHFPCLVFIQKRWKKKRMKTEKRNRRCWWWGRKSHVPHHLTSTLHIPWCMMDLFGCAVKRAIFYFFVLLLNLPFSPFHHIYHAITYASMCMPFKILPLLPTPHNFYLYFTYKLISYFYHNIFNVLKLIMSLSY